MVRRYKCDVIHNLEAIASLENLKNKCRRALFFSVDVLDLHTQGNGPELLNTL